ncbi:MAG: hypothetical protein ACE5GK_12380 [Nitrospiria bacterium]
MQFFILFNTFLVMYGCFLTWIEPKIFVVAMRGIDMIDGKIVFGLGLIGFFGIAYELIRKRKAFYWVYGGVGLIVTVISGVVFFNYYQNNYNGGPGIYLSALGGIQLVGSYVAVLLQGLDRSRSR